VFQHDSFEPGLVVVAFLVYLNGFHWLDAVGSQIWPLKSALLRWRVEQGNTDMRSWAYEGLTRIKNEAAWYVLPLLIFDILYPRRRLPLHAPSAAQLAAEVRDGCAMSLRAARICKHCLVFHLLC
jgi:hypothetical protein